MPEDYSNVNLASTKMGTENLRHHERLVFFTFVFLFQYFYVCHTHEVVWLFFYPSNLAWSHLRYPPARLGPDCLKSLLNSPHPPTPVPPFWGRTCRGSVPFGWVRFGERSARSLNANIIYLFVYLELPLISVHGAFASHVPPIYRRQTSAVKLLPAPGVYVS